MKKHLHTETVTHIPAARSRRAIAWLTLVVYVGQPLAVSAQVVADSAASAQKRPVIDTTANGIPLVQIATPNASGLSHNQYTQYNVDPSGVILNNGANVSLTQQAGYVPGNQNMANGSARIILNEVTSTSPSQLNGYTEVAGSRAEVIIANPNGITCNGCGFINTSRGVLTTGTPVFGGSGSLDAFRVSGGEINIGASGLNASNTSQLDLIARSVKVNGELWATDLNVITGTNQINYANLGVQVINGDANKPTVGIDVAQLGGMYANKIRLIGTEAGVGVNSQGNIATQAGDIVIDNQGVVTLAGNTSAAGNLNISSATGIQNTGTLQSQQSTQLTSQGNLTNSGNIYALGNLSVQAANITTSGNLGAGVDVGGNVVPGVTLTLNATAPAGAIVNSGRIAADNVASNSYAFTNTGTILGGSVDIAAYNLDNLGTNAYIGASRVVNLKVANALNNYDTLLESEDAANPSASRATIFSLGDINIGSALDASGNPIANTASVSNSSGNIEAGNMLRIGADQITNKRTVVGLEWGASWDGTPVAGVNGTGGAMGDPAYTPTYRDQHFIATTTARAKMVSGGDMLLSGVSLLNDYSDIIAGGTLSTPMSGAITNNGTPFQREETRAGRYTYQIWTVVGGHDDCYPCHWVYDYGWATTTTPYTYGPASYDISAPQSTKGGGNPNVSVGTMSAVSVPTSGPFTIQAQPNQPYLVVTAPQFTSYQSFVSSDYMMGRLVLDPGMVQKRLGDGFYEQKLVADQILHATGKRNLTGYSNTQAAYQALMDQALAESHDLKLIPGVALTKDQVAALRHDIVWMVAEDVKLPDGSTVKALAPKVYFSQSSQMRLNQGGSLIAANEISIQTGGVLDNQGRIISDTATSLIVNDLVNRGAVQSGGALYLQAANDVNNKSGTLAGKDVQIIAGRDINNQRVSDESGLHQQGNIIAGNSLNMTAGRDITMAAGGVQTGGNASLTAAGKVDIGVLETHNSNRGGNNSYIDTTTNLGSTLDIGGSLSMQSGKDMTLTAATLNAGGNMTLLSGGNLDIKAAKDTRSSGYSTETNQARNYDETVQGSTLTAGGNLILAATARNGEGHEDDDSHSSGHNINLESATLASNAGTLALVADNSVNIGVTEEKHSAYFATHEENNGFFSSKSTDRRTLSKQSYAIGSELSGERVLIQAGNQEKKHGKEGSINVTGSSIAATGDVSLQAANDISIKAATSTSSSSSYSRTKESGLMSNGGLSITFGEREQTDKFDSTNTLQSQNRSMVGSTGGNLNIKAGGNALVSGSDLVAANDLKVEARDITVNSGFDQSINTQSHDTKQSGLTIALSSNVTSAVQTADQMQEIGKQSKNKRTQALAAATAAMALANGASASPSVSVSATVGSSESHSDSTQTSSRSSGSLLNAGGNITLVATAGKEESGKGGNITIQGSDVKAGNDINLSADRNINLLAEQNSNSQISHNSSSSSGAGVSVSSQTGLGITANAAAGRGNADGRDTSYTNTHLAAGSALNLKSGGDTTLRGAIATGKQVTADIGGSLTIESLQDTSTYASKQESASASGTIGLTGPSSASLTGSQSHINGNYASVREQSGIQAGDGGFQIAVKGNTALKGAVIESSETASTQGKNSLTTATLTTSDIGNVADYDAQSLSMTVGTSGVSPPMAMNASDSNRSTTRSGISAGAIVITDDKKQEELTGKDGKTTVASLNRDVATGKDTSGAIDNNLDVGEIQAGFAVTQAFVQQANTFVASQAQKADRAKAELKAEQEKPKEQQNSDKIAQLSQDIEDAAKWAPGGTYRQVMTAITAASSGNVTAGTSQMVQAASVNYLQSLGAEQIKAMAKDLGGEGSPAHTALHGILACAGAAAQSANCGTAALGASSGVVLNTLLSGDPEKMTAEQKENRRNLVATLVAGIATAAGSKEVSTAVNAATIETENNYLGRKQASRLSELRSQKTLGKCGANCERDIAQLKVLDEDNNRALAACSGVNSGNCDAIRQEVRNAAAGYIRNYTSPKNFDIRDTYQEEKSETLALAQGTMDGKALGAIQGAADTMVDGAIGLGKLIMAVSGSAFGDKQSAQNLRDGAGAAYEFLKDPNNWPQLLGAMSPQDREKLALAYEEGDGKTVGQLMGAQIVNLPVSGGGALGTIRKIDKVAEVTVEVGTVEKAATGAAKGEIGAVADDAAREAEILAGSKLSHINGSIGELRGYQSAIDDLGHVGIQRPGKVTSPGPDFITYDPTSQNVVIWDAKYRGPNGAYPSTLAADKINTWGLEVRDAVQNLPPGSLRDAAMDALNNGRIQGQIFRWPN